MTTMLEKMAREIAMCFVPHDEVDQAWPKYEPTARAALLAIREPAPSDSILAAQMAGNELCYPADAGVVALVRAKIIDAILNEPSTI